MRSFSSLAKKSWIALIIGALVLFNALAADRPAAPNPELSLQLAEQFVAVSRAGDVDKMIELTHPRMRAQTGDAMLRAMYSADTAPFFKNSKPLGEAQVADFITDDETGYAGWEVSQQFVDEGPRTVEVSLVILPEDTKLFVAAIGLKTPKTSATPL